MKLYELGHPEYQSDCKLPSLKCNVIDADDKVSICVYTCIKCYNIFIIIMYDGI